MNIIILNGSPRKDGNTIHMINRFVEGLDKSHKIAVINLEEKKLKGCSACYECSKTHSCVEGDDAAKIISYLVKADLIVFASPVYWWGVSSQLKMIIDKFISNVEGLKNKKAGLMLVGASELSDTQYRLIGEQFQCISVYLKWNVLFQKEISSGNGDSIEEEIEFLSEITEIAQDLK